MTNKKKRVLLFLLGCIGVRLSLVFIAKYVPKKVLPYLGGLALLPSIGFFTIYFTNSRKTGPEVFGGKIWWNRLRPVHGLLYLIFAILAFKENEYAWVVLLIDVFIGLSAFVIHHTTGINF